MARELKSNPLLGVPPCTAVKESLSFAFALGRSNEGITAKIKRIKAVLFFRVIARYESKRVAKDSEIAPPNETVAASGESIWLKAILVHEKPPNGNRDFTSSISRIAVIKRGRFEVYRARIPIGIK
jgi:hypothetical protein